jgi:hypothetical protein
MEYEGEFGFGGMSVKQVMHSLIKKDYSLKENRNRLYILILCFEYECVVLEIPLSIWKI